MQLYAELAVFGSWYLFLASDDRNDGPDATRVQLAGPAETLEGLLKQAAAAPNGPAGPIRVMLSVGSPAELNFAPGRGSSMREG